MSSLLIDVNSQVSQGNRWVSMVLLLRIIEGWFRLSFCDSNVWLHWSQFLFVDWISSNAIILIVSFFSSWSLSKKSKGSLDWRSVTLFLTASFSNLECFHYFHTHSFLFRDCTYRMLWICTFHNFSGSNRLGFSQTCTLQFSVKHNSNFDVNQSNLVKTELSFV